MPVPFVLPFMLIRFVPRERTIDAYKPSAGWQLFVDYSNLAKTFFPLFWESVPV